MKTNKKLKILVIYGGPSLEHDISLKTGEMVAENLDKKLYKVEKVKISKNNLWFFNESKTGKKLYEALKVLAERKYDAAFIAIHGYFGEDGRLQAILENIGLPYTGSGVLASVLAMDKEMANRIFESNKILVPKFWCFNKHEWQKNQLIVKKKIVKNLPIVVKPITGGSSVATNIVKKISDIDKAVGKVFKLFDKVMVQRFVEGNEITCSIIEKNNQPYALPLIRIVPKKSTFYDYKAKYNQGGSMHELPAKISSKLTKEIQNLALKAHQAIGCWGMSRVDFLLNKNKPFILEINTIPGMTKTSLLPEAAKAAGISFDKLLNMIINSALKRQIEKFK